MTTFEEFLKKAHAAIEGDQDVIQEAEQETKQQDMLDTGQDFPLPLRGEQIKKETNWMKEWEREKEESEEREEQYRKAA